MLFNSLAYALFLPVVMTLYWRIPSRRVSYQNALLLAASYVFYGWWDWRFLGLIALSSVIDYAVGIGLERRAAPRRALLCVSLGANLGLLGFFKYFNFFAESLQASLSAIGIEIDRATLEVVLPVGISFYTFQTLSYSIDVYRGKIPACRDALAFFAYVAFFPQLVAGPIERAGRLLPQFRRPRNFDPAAARDAARRMLWGFFKKIVIANNLAPAVDRIFEGYAHAGPAELAAGALLFAVQIYCDFSGYSEIAIGTAKLFGFDLMTNFRTPYFATDLRDFWRRWHISLSTWFRDYVYVPLGGARAGLARGVGSVMAVFLLSGLWHGANWTFVVWGAMHGIAYLAERWAGGGEARTSGAVARGFGWIRTQAVVLLGWVFFRSASLSGALGYLRRFGEGLLEMAPVHVPQARALAAGLGCLAVEWFMRRRAHTLDIASWPGATRWAVYYALALLMFFYGNTAHVPFIYFQF